MDNNIRHKAELQQKYSLRCVHSSTLFGVVLLILAFMAQVQPTFAANCESDSFEITLNTGLQIRSEPKPILLCVGQILTIETDEPIGSIVNGQPKIAAANVATADKVLITALEQGSGTLLLLSRDRKRQAKFNITTRFPQPPLDNKETDDAPMFDITVYRGTEAQQILCKDSCTDN